MDLSNFELAIAFVRLLTPLNKNRLLYGLWLKYVAEVRAFEANSLRTFIGTPKYQCPRVSLEASHLLRPSAIKASSSSGSSSKTYSMTACALPTGVFLTSRRNVASCVSFVYN